MNITVASNTLGSGDWIYVKDAQGNVIFEGHRVGAEDLVEILCSLNVQAEFIPVTDEQMEEGF